MPAGDGEAEGGVGVWPVGVQGASQDPTAQQLITGHPAATAALAPVPAAARLVLLILCCPMSFSSTSWNHQQEHEIISHQLEAALYQSTVPFGIVVEKRKPHVGLAICASQGA